ncbi:MAG: hypothetical protein WBD87_16030, partial [Candidatus Acidiferrales bacterium]
MSVQESPRIDSQADAQSLIDAAGALLALRQPGIPRDFLSALFGLAVPEDLERYSAEQIAAIADDAWSFLAQRQPGSPKIRRAPLADSIGGSALDIVNDDMPFLVDSVAGELHERGLDILLLVHPVFSVERDAAGNLVGFDGVRRRVGRGESYIRVHIDGVEEAAAGAAIVSEIEDILAEVRVCVDDWQAMIARAREVIADLRKNPPPLPVEDIAEAVQFLEWLAADNFTLLGARDYAYTDDEQALQPIFETGLGILRSPQMRLLRRGSQLVTITPEIREFLEQPRLLIVAKAAVRSRVHRRVHLDYVGVKRFDPEGRLIGERRFCGLFTS